MLENPAVSTIAEIAQRLRVSTRTVYNLIDQKALPVIRVGRVLRVPTGAVDALLTSGGSLQIRPPGMHRQKTA